MKGEKGTCTQGERGNEVRRTKFKSEETCIAGMNTLKEIDVIPSNYIVYHCKCGSYHFGKQEWADKFKK